MKIWKIGHCCLLIETAGLKILTDPGSFSAEQNSITGIGLVLITHEHADHLHVDSLKAVIKNNPTAIVITNVAVGRILATQNIEHFVLGDKKTKEVLGILIEAFDGKHEEIYKDIGQVQNTGYLIDEKLFYPGDSFFEPGKPVEILALPVGGPWCRLADAINYAIKVKPKKAFPVHDGTIRQDFVGMSHRIPAMILQENDIEFVSMLAGETKDF